MPRVSLQNEMAAWKLIDKVADEALALYPTSFEVDMEILERDKYRSNPEEKLTLG